MSETDTHERDRDSGSPPPDPSDTAGPTPDDAPPDRLKPDERPAPRWRGLRPDDPRSYDLFGFSVAMWIAVLLFVAFVIWRAGWGGM